MSARRVAVILCLGFALGGCSVVPSYRTATQAPHKDVLRCVIYLERRADSEVYQRIALDEFAKIQRREGGREVPLYEVTFEFLKAGSDLERFAEVKVFLGGAPEPVDRQVAAARAPSMETILY